MMRKLLGLVGAVLLVMGLLAPTALEAAPYTDRAALDELFAQLKVAQSVAEADEIGQEIWTFWLNPDVPDLAGRMSEANGAMTSGDFPRALSILSAVVKDYPDYAEGWNQRATLYYILSDFTDSLSDIDKVLSLEPRHFGALSGRALIYLKQGKRADALRDMIAALAIHPFLGERKLFPELAPNVTHV